MIALFNTYKKWTSTGLAILLLMGSLLPVTGLQLPKASAAADHVVISQISGGGGNTGAPAAIYKNDFIELYNPTDTDVDLTGWSVQYASSTSSLSALWTNITPLTGTIKAHSFYLIQEAAGTGTTMASLPTPDASGTIAMAGPSGKVALVNKTEAITGRTNPSVIDFVGYGAANDSEGLSTAALTNPTSAQRKAEDGSNSAADKGAGWDTDNNNTDFVVGPIITPRNSATPAVVVTKSSQPIPQNIQFTNLGTLGTVVGYTAAVTASTYVSLYVSNPDTASVAVTNAVYADGNGEFNLTFDNTANKTQVYMTTKETGKTESSAVMINLAAESAGLNASKLSYFVDPTTHVGKVTGSGGTPGAAAANSKVYVYNLAAAGNRFTTTTDGKDYVVSAADGSFTFTFNAGTDDVYVSQLTSGAYGISLEGSVTKITKADTTVVTPISSLRTNDNNGKSDKINQIFTIQGVVIGNNEVTAANTFYMQDDTGGIAVFGALPSGVTVAQGDVVMVTGAVQFYNGLTEITPTSVVKKGTGSLPLPKDATIVDLIDNTKAEPLEGSLVKFTGKVTDIPAISGNGYNITVADAAGKTITLRVTTASGINTTTNIQKDSTYTFTGIFSQYDSSSPYNSGYQVFPRSVADVTEIKELTLSHQPATQAYINTDIKLIATAKNANSVVIYYRATGGTTYSALPMTSTDQSSYSVTLPAALVPAGSTFDYYIEAKDATTTKQSGSPTTPNVVSVVADTFAPQFMDETPIQGTKTEDRQPLISVQYVEPSGLDLTTLAVTLDGQSVQATTTDEQIQLQISSDLAIADHTVIVNVKDMKGNAGTYTWSFSVVPVFTGGNHYRGTTHNHTDISHDASGTPEQALLAAKAHNYDYFAFSDHSHDIDAALVGQDTVDHKGSPERTGGADWKLTKNLATQYTQNNNFVVFPAFEMTSTTWGHSNVFGTENFIDRKMNAGQYQDLSKYYAWVLTYDDVVAQFNHPDMSANAFNNFMPYDRNVDKLFTMLEVGNGSGHYAYANAEGKFFSALDLGWHVAPTYGEDNHDGTWGQTNARTVIVANDLSQESLLQSMRNMRVYMSEDPNFSLDFLANGSYMGATVKGSTLNFSVSGKDPVKEVKTMPEYNYLSSSYKSDDRVAKVELITNGNKVVQSISPMSADFTWNPTVDITGGQQWFVVKVTQMDGERIYSAPIWSQVVTTDVKISGINVVGDSIVGGSPATLEAGLTNLGSQDLTNLNVHFYYDAVDDAHLIGNTSVALISSKGTATARVTWAAPMEGDHTLIAVLDAPPGDSPADNQFVQAVKIKPSLGIKVMIDASHKNENTTLDAGTYKDNLKSFTKQLQQEGYTVVENTTAITSSSLSDVKVLMFTHPSVALTADESAAIAAFVQAGGSLLLTEKSNNSANPAISNNLLQQIGSTIQVSNDGIFDTSLDGNFWTPPIGTNTFTVRLHPGIVKNYITDRALTVEYYSGASLEKVGHIALIDTDKVTVLVKGNETTFQNNIGSGGYSYDTTDDGSGGSAIPAIASEQVGNGRIIVSGMNTFNDKQMDESYNPKGNNELGLNAINWLAHRDTQVDTIANARTKADGTSLIIEGTVVTGSNVFFDAFYVQDATGGIMAFKELPENTLVEGDTVRIYGQMKTFENNKELDFGAFNLDVIKTGHTNPITPQMLTTGQATLEQNQGLLVKVRGRVVSKFDDNSYVINDGTGPVLVFTDGYIVNQSGSVPSLVVGDALEAVGLASKNTEGTRIRVRNTQELSKIRTETAVSSSTIAVTNEPLTINVGSGITDVKISVPTTTDGTTRTATLPFLEVNTVSTSLGGNVSVAIPDSTIITAPDNWDGKIRLPEVQSNSSVSVSHANVNSVIEVGAPGVMLTFNKAVRLVVPGQAGKSAGYVRDGVFHEITTTLTADNQTTANLLPDGGEAKMNVGSDLVIWTKHFTQFVSYTSVDTTTPTGGGGGAELSPNTAIIYATNGGTVTLNGAKIAVPAGSVNGNVSNFKVTVNKVVDTSSLAMDSSLKLISDVFDITKDFAGEFSKSVQITLPFDKNKVDTSQSLVSIYWLNEETKKWIQLENPQLDSSGATVTGSVNHFTKFAVLASAKPSTPIALSDTKGHWAEKSILELVQKGSIHGYPDGTFKPDTNITRAEFVSIIVKAFNLKEQMGKIFADTSNHWAKNAIATAASQGIINGYSDTAFGPDDTISREQMAAIIVRAAQISLVAEVSTFTDRSEISDWAIEAISAANSKGLMNGYEDGTVKPKGKATRAEAATVILRALALKK
ncbi:Ig domain-containing protein group 2 domain-containing protein [Paenibacillus sp. LMG 31461]|uniref:Ig domain-containing protein group 2 domain-containing protein n=1 Tax=Paenibacillus plantarum TaxID=2654975 RepID=A0ABX1X4T9_9BACL|nr:DUF4350 domain-containing protein [Paenibacillus plantarum]NOU63324.1 Ig domain-containing protein group 2 domain-containing protein [Paenibacillus plantarum]